MTKIKVNVQKVETKNLGFYKSRYSGIDTIDALMVQDKLRADKADIYNQIKAQGGTVSIDQVNLLFFLNEQCDKLILI